MRILQIGDRLIIEHSMERLIASLDCRQPNTILTCTVDEVVDVKGTL